MALRNRIGQAFCQVYQDMPAGSLGMHLREAFPPPAHRRRGNYRMDRSQKPARDMKGGGGAAGGDGLAGTSKPWQWIRRQASTLRQ